MTPDDLDPHTDSLAEIARKVAARHGLQVAELKGRSQARRESNPRQEAMARASLTRRWSRGQVGAYFNRTTWTVTHAEEVFLRRQAEGQGDAR
jgi:chromosomal replication initiation ATPase DnaA